MLYDYSDTLESYMIPMTESLVSYVQNYDEKFRKEKINLKDFQMIKIDLSNVDLIRRKYKHLKLEIPFLNVKGYFKDGTIEFRWYHQERKDPIATASIAPAKNVQSKIPDPNLDVTKYWLRDLVVDPKYQGANLGTQITQMLIDQYHIGYLETFKDGRVAIQVYKKLGFKIYHEDETLYYMKRK